MSLNYYAVKNWDFGVAAINYEPRDTILYAMGVGAGSEAVEDPALLRFVYERQLQAFPTMAVVLGFPGFWMSDQRTGIDATRIVHGEQHLELHQPLPAAGKLTAHNKVIRITDKGEGKGALVTIERTLHDATSGDLVATLQQVTFCRGDGGYSASGAPSDPPAPPLPGVPDRTSDKSVSLPTRQEMGLLYRLSGDLNPLHADPAVATAAGFPKPILHGLATYGLAGRAVLGAFCANDPSCLASLSARFTAPTYPGETLVTDMWLQDGEVRFRCSVAERNIVALNNGVARLR